jgi:hypothetical protein
MIFLVLKITCKINKPIALVIESIYLIYVYILYTLSMCTVYTLHTYLWFVSKSLPT